MTQESGPSSRVAIVTGAARGIGAAVAKRLAADGKAVAVLDLKEADCAGTVEAITSAGGRAIAVGADVSQADQVAAGVEKVAAELGPPAVLVNNAGVLRDNLLFKMSDDDWDTVMGVHLRGAFLMTRAAQKYMVDQRFGRVISLSSSSALGNRGQANYSTAKAGLQGFTKTLAIELGQFGITANAIAPGFIVTDMTAATAARIGVDFADFQKAAAERIPVGRRLVQATLLSGAIAALASSATVLGYKGHFEAGLGAGAGFGGIAVAMLGRGSALGLVASALLFGTLEQGGLAINAYVPMESMQVLEGVIIVAVALADAQVRASVFGSPTANRAVA